MAGESALSRALIGFRAGGGGLGEDAVAIAAGDTVLPVERIIDLRMA
jgi:hypothetical protein